MPIPIWAESTLLSIAAFVVSPAIAAAIGYAAWKGKPQNWDRSMYWTALVSSMIASIAFGSLVHRMEAGLLEVGLALLVVLLLLGVSGGRAIGIFVYARGKGPIWREPKREEQQAPDGDQS